MLMKAMLVDDEPFILQGLSILIDWEAEGYEIVKKASDGKEALDYLRENKVDLIITDIRMPRINGLELLEIIRKENISDAYIIVLSGYNDFKYAQAALRYSCMDYILKPVQKEQLIANIRRAATDKENTAREEIDNERMHRGYLHICLNNLSALEEMSDEEVAELKNKVYEQAAYYLQSDADHLFKDFFVYNRMKTEYTTLQYELMKLLSSVMQQSGSADSAKFNSAAVTPVTIRAAATVVTMAPIVCLYPFLQRYFVAGLTIGGVKE